ncbi:hypothetical protein L2089_07205 [Paenibacillus hunanensis]|uniref:hypothetical protein n=1 Tax=Paenibacillus hunanensis TaxID=539262 RepID=UPI002025DEE8|nr:hypothetical protein [Paenibacillus hunanensis]MCL9660468.1 hypothetical protein [Paenibacillus hunanensis]
MLEAIRFVFFSSIEYLAIFALMLSIFRLKPLEYIGTVSFIVLIMSLMSYMLRTELDLSFMMTAVSTISYILINATIVRISLLWSAILAACGMFVYTVIQALVILTLFGSFTPDMQYSGTGTIIQIVSSVITFGICYVLQFFKFGFIADFEKFSFRFEHIAIVFLTVIALVLASLLMYYNNLYYIIFFLALLAAIFIYYSIIKERAAYD